jgi:hypothetical protein
MTPLKYNGQPSPASTATSPAIADKQRRRLARKLLKDLAAFTAVAVHELAPAPRPPRPRRQLNRLLYRKTLTDAELDMLVIQVGGDRMLKAVDRYTRPTLPLIAAE